MKPKGKDSCILSLHSTCFCPFIQFFCLKSDILGQVNFAMYYFDISSDVY